MITCIYDYISKNKCIKCMILMHEIACYQGGTTGDGILSWGKPEVNGVCLVFPIGCCADLKG